MQRSIKTRLNTLEKAANPAKHKIVLVWRETGETPEQAIARRFNGNAPENTKVIVAGWMES